MKVVAKNVNNAVIPIVSNPTNLETRVLSGEVLPTFGNKKPLTKFTSKAIDAYSRTYQALFAQASLEADRLQKINSTLKLLEDSLLDPDTVRDMEPSQKIMLFDLLTKNSQLVTKNLMSFGTMFLNIRNVVSFIDGLNNNTDSDTFVRDTLGNEVDDDLETLKKRLQE